MRDVQTGEIWHFVCNGWLAPDRGDRLVHQILHPTNQNVPQPFKYVFLTKSGQQMRDAHLWLSIWTRPPSSTFTRAQRLTCALTFLLTAMLANLMFYGTTDDPEDQHSIGQFTINVAQLMVSVQSLVITVPANLIVVLIFRKLDQPPARHKDNTSPEIILKTTQTIYSDPIEDDSSLGGMAEYLDSSASKIGIDQKRGTVYLDPHEDLNDFRKVVEYMDSSLAQGLNIENPRIEHLDTSASNIGTDQKRATVYLDPSEDLSDLRKVTEYIDSSLAQRLNIEKSSIAHLDSSASKVVAEHRRGTVYLDPSDDLSGLGKVAEYMDSSLAQGLNIGRPRTEDMDTSVSKIGTDQKRRTVYLDPHEDRSGLGKVDGTTNLFDNIRKLVHVWQMMDEEFEDQTLFDIADDFAALRDHCNKYLNTTHVLKVEDEFIPKIRHSKKEIGARRGKKMFMADRMNRLVLRKQTLTTHDEQDEIELQVYKYNEDDEVLSDEVQNIEVEIEVQEESVIKDVGNSLGKTKPEVMFDQGKTKAVEMFDQGKTKAVEMIDQGKSKAVEMFDQGKTKAVEMFDQVANKEVTDCNKGGESQTGYKAVIEQHKHSGVLKQNNSIEEVILEVSSQSQEDIRSETSVNQVHLHADTNITITPFTQV